MRPNDRGFTLLEVLIALTIVAALLAVAFGGLRVALAAWTKGEDRAEAHQHARGVTLSLARAAAGTYPYLGTRSEAPESVLLFTGQKERIEFVTQAPPFPFPIPIAFAAVVIELGEGEQRGLVVRQRALPNWNPFKDATVVLNDPTVTSIEFAYLDSGGEWQETWDVDAKQVLPNAIRITLGTEAGGKSVTVPPMTVSLQVVAP
jgi:general secretion pathway protein J